MAMKNLPLGKSLSILTEIMVICLHCAAEEVEDGDGGGGSGAVHTLFKQYIHHCSLRIQGHDELSRECFSDLFLSIVCSLNVTYLIHAYTQCFSLALSGLGKLPLISVNVCRRCKRAV